jgi:hypothetical protein
MRRTWAIIVMVMAVLVVNIIIYQNGEVINNWFNSENADRVMIVVLGAGGLIVPLVQNAYERKQKRSDEEKQALEKHKRDLVNNFEQARGLLQYQFGLLESLDRFSFKKELYQHMFTGHNTVFNRIREASIDEADRYDANQHLVKYAQDRMAESAEKLGLAHGQHGADKPFYSDSASQHLISLVVTGKDQFYAHYGGSYINEVYRQSNGTVSQCAGFLSKEQATQYSSALNELAKDTEILKKYENRQDLIKKAEESNKDALDAFRDLLSTIQLNGPNLAGGCHVCVNMTGQKDKTALAEKLREFDKIDWVKQQLKR